MNSTHWATWLTSEKTLPWLGAFIAALIACWVNYQAHGVINNDGILYLEVAQLFDAGQWRQGVATYNWPLYPFLIMLVHQFSGLGFQISANLLAVLFFAATGLGLATLIRDLGGSRNTVIAGLALLIATPYMVGDILPMVVREHGYWAFHVWSLIFLLRFTTSHAWHHALLWGACAVICTLFRIEGLTYLVLAPLALLADTSRPLAQRWYGLFKAQALLIAAGLLLTVVVLGHPSLSLQDMGRLREPVIILELVYQQITSGLAQRAEIIGQQALGSYMDDYGMPTLLLGMAYILLVKATTVAGLLQSGLVLTSWKKFNGLMSPQHWQLLKWMLLLGLLNAAVILVKGFVMPKRILTPIGLVIVAMAALAVPTLLESLRRGSGRIRLLVLSLLGLLLLMQLLTALRPSSTDIRYERDAVEWVKANASPNSRIYYQTDRLRFYAGLPRKNKQNWTEIQAQAWLSKLEAPHPQKEIGVEDTINFETKSYDYYLLSTKNEQIDILTSHLGPPLKVFKGKRDKVVLIFGQNIQQNRVVH